MSSIQISLLDYFKDCDEFTLKEAEDVVTKVLKLDVKLPSIRARIYEGIDKGLFKKIARGVYKRSTDECTCLLINGDGRDLSMFKNNSVDAIITDHPYDLATNKGGNRNFTDSYSCFQYNEKDFQEKFRVLKQGAFLVEFLPEESGGNWEYLNKIKTMAKDSGFLYYAKVSWIKGNQVNNTGRKSSNSEDILFLSKGKARELRLDTKKNIAELEQIGISSKGRTSEEIKQLLEQNNKQVHYMSGTNGMLPTAFIFEPPSKKDRIHQSQKPKELYKEIEKYVTLEFERVIDQFAGSCSIGEASLEMNRNCIMFEINKEIVDDVLKNYEKRSLSFQEIKIAEDYQGLNKNNVFDTKDLEIEELEK